MRILAIVLLALFSNSAFSAAANIEKIVRWDVAAPLNAYSIKNSTEEVAEGAVVVFTLEAGEAVVIVGNSSPWANVTKQGGWESAYVRQSDLVDPSTPQPDPTPAFDPSPVGDWVMGRETLVEDLNVYTESNSESAISFTLPEHTAIKVIAGDGEWHQVEDKQGRTGYVYYKSVDPFKADLRYIERKVYESIFLYKMNDAVYIHTADRCYILELSKADILPVTEETKISLLDMLNNQGGYDILTQQQKDNCGIEE